MGMLTATGFTIGEVTRGGFPMPGPSKRLTIWLPYVVSSAIVNAAHVHAVTAKGRRYFYDRPTRQRLTEDEVSERLERTKIEQKL